MSGRCVSDRMSIAIAMTNAITDHTVKAAGYRNGVMMMAAKIDLPPTGVPLSRMAVHAAEKQVGHSKIFPRS